MTLTPDQAQALRNKMLVDLDNNHPEPFDERFLNPIWGNFENFLRWCKRWNIQFDQFTLKGVRRTNDTAIQWIQLKHPEELHEPKNPLDL